MQEVFVSKSKVDYDFSAYDELKYIVGLIPMMLSSNIPTHMIVGFSLQANIERLVKSEKYKMIEALLLVNLNSLPRDDFVLQEYICTILLAIPLDKKELAERLILALESKFGQLEVQFTKTSNPSSSEISVRGAKVEVKSGSEDVSQKISWFRKA